MASSFDIHNISYNKKSEMKHDNHETDDRYVVLKLRLGGASTLDLEFRKKLINCNNWSIVLYGAETWTLSGSRSEKAGMF
jgi:hypothetical protein